MWWVKKKLSEIPVENYTETLRRIANEGKEFRISEELTKITKILEDHARWYGIVPKTLRFKTELESEILHELAYLGLNVDLTSRKEPTDAEIAIGGIYAYSGTVTYEVTF